MLIDTLGIQAHIDSHMKAYIVMTEHDSFRLACGARSVDQDTALVSSLTADNVIQLFFRNIQTQLYELLPLPKSRNIPFGTQAQQS